MKKIEVLGLQTLPEIQSGDNLAEMIVQCAKAEGVPLQDNDVIVLTSKIVSKALNLMINKEQVEPSPAALVLSRKTGKDARLIQMMWDRGHEILAMIPMKGLIRTTIMESSKAQAEAQELCDHEGAMCITRDRKGRINTQDAGIDGSNHPKGTYSYPPPDPDQTARTLREQIQNLCGKSIAVILADTELFDIGTMDLAIGSSGIHPRPNWFGMVDKFGRPKFGGMDIVAHEMTAAAALLFGQLDAGIPAVIVRGYEFEIDESTGIADVLSARMSKADYRMLVRNILKTSSYAHPWPRRWFLRIAAWSV
ncbi:MAG: coenzyme F420-0:L-glutamate ligase [Sedimentisphaerales bacterium]|nr:coenzyme F420-0:L-glutamate ligase [Sedimentisphaerales bacterium]